MASFVNNAELLSYQYFKTTLVSVSLHCKSCHFKTANIEILSANSMHRSYLYQSVAHHKFKRSLLCFELVAASRWH